MSNKDTVSMIQGNNLTYSAERLVLIVCIWYRLCGVIPVAQNSHDLPLKLLKHDVPHADVSVKDLLFELGHFLNHYQLAISIAP